MKIGLIFYSYTGHTAQVASQLAKSLENAGHVVDNIALETVDPLILSATHAAIRNIPSIASYDALVIGTPVHGGRISAPVLTFLEKTPSLDGLPVVFLVTHFFPHQWGAAQVIAALEGFCTSKSGTVLGSSDVAWLNIFRKKQIHAAVTQLCRTLKGIG